MTCAFYVQVMAGNHTLYTVADVLTLFAVINIPTLYTMADDQIVSAVVDAPTLSDVVHIHTLSAVVVVLYLL